MQEAGLAQTLSFQFANDCVELNWLQATSLREFYDVGEVSRSIGLATSTLLFAVKDAVRSIRSDKEISVARFCYGIRYRSTTRTSDAAICGSILLGSDLGPVLAVPNAKKVQVFWSCQKSVPAGRGLALSCG